LEQLAAEMGLTYQQVQKYETGGNRISASRLYDAAVILEISPSWFFQGLPRIECDARPLPLSPLYPTACAEPLVIDPISRRRE
jgi:transcriptional regulator with XRE-family HTH domain